MSRCLRYGLLLLPALLYAGLCSAQLSQRPESCPSGPSSAPESQGTAEEQQSEQPPRPFYLKIESVVFKSDQPLPSISKELAAAVEAVKRIEFDETWDSEVVDKIKDVWQHRGYFNIQIERDDVDREDLNEPAEGEDEFLARIIVKINPGRQYHTGTIKFLHNTQFDSAQLRALFPIQEAEIFDTRKIAQGMEAARKAYGERGFINFTAVPETAVNEDQGNINLTIDVEEGPQFRVGTLKILGLDPALTQQLIDNSGLEPGSVFNPGEVETFFERNKSLLPPDAKPEDAAERAIHESERNVDLTMDFRVCPMPQSGSDRAATTKSTLTRKEHSEKQLEFLQPLMTLQNARP